MGRLRHALFEILRARLKEGLMLVPRDILAHEGTAALQMAHLAEHPAVRGEGALDGLQRAVGVHVDIHRGGPVQVHILGGDLAVGDQGLQGGLGGHEAALAVGDGDGVQDVYKRQVGVGGGMTNGDRSVRLAEFSEHQGASGVVVNLSLIHI